MTSKQTITGQKFFRRTSRSPWESSINTTHHQCDQSLNNLHEKSLGSEEGKNSRITIKGQFPISISAIFDQLNPGQKRGLNQYYVGSARKAPNCSFLASSPKLVKNSQQIKLTYIPIQTMGTLETLPGGSKKGLDNSETKGRMIKNQHQKYIAQLQKVNKQLCTLKMQNHQLQQMIKQKNQQNSKLLNENNFNRDNALHLQCQLRRVSMICNEMEFRIRQDQSRIQNLNRQLMINTQLRIKQEQKTRNIAQNMKRIEQQLKIRIDVAKQLQRLLEIKQKQISQLRRNQNINNQNCLNINKLKQDRVLKQVSLSLKQNNKCYDKQNTIKKPTRTKQCMQRSQQKYNRFIQTDTCPLEECLKNNQYLTLLLQEKQKIIMDRNMEINQLSFQMKNYEQIKERIYQCEILIEELNNDKMANLAVKLAAKYKYY